MTAGRRPMPTRLHELRGNPGKRPLNDAEPVPPAGAVAPPSWLKGRARNLWKELEPMLSAMRVMTTADVQALASLCETQAEFITARLDVRRRGTEIEMTRYDRKGNAFTVTELNPSVKIASDAGKRARSLMVEFGLTPSARSRLKAAPQEQGEDKWAGLL